MGGGRTPGKLGYAGAQRVLARLRLPHRHAALGHHRIERPANPCPAEERAVSRRCLAAPGAPGARQREGVARRRVG